MPGLHDSAERVPEREERGTVVREGRIGVVLVTDVRLMRDGLIQVLANHERVHILGSAATRVEALDAVERLAHAVILLDVSSAECFGAVHVLRAAVPSARAVAFAINGGEDELLDCVEAGFCGFVARDGSVHDLVTAIESAMRGEAVCSARVVAGMMRRLAALAESRASELPATELSARERQIIELIDAGLSNKEIAHRLHIGVATVKNHVHNILEKLHVSRRGEAAAYLRDASAKPLRAMHRARSIHD